MLVELVEAVVLFPAGAAIGLALARRRRPPPIERCTGYHHVYSDGEVGSGRDDCRAHRNPLCSDGRCTLHCRQHCKCERGLAE